MCCQRKCNRRCSYRWQLAIVRCQAHVARSGVTDYGIERGFLSWSSDRKGGIPRNSSPHRQRSHCQAHCRQRGTRCTSSRVTRPLRFRDKTHHPTKKLNVRAGDFARFVPIPARTRPVRQRNLNAFPVTLDIIARTRTAWYCRSLFTHYTAASQSQLVGAMGNARCSSTGMGPR